MSSASNQGGIGSVDEGGGTIISQTKTTSHLPDGSKRIETALKVRNLDGSITERTSTVTTNVSSSPDEATYELIGAVENIPPQPSAPPEDRTSLRSADVTVPISFADDVESNSLMPATVPRATRLENAGSAYLATVKVPVVSAYAYPVSLIEAEVCDVCVVGELGVGTVGANPATSLDPTNGIVHEEVNTGETSGFWTINKKIGFTVVLIAIIAGVAASTGIATQVGVNTQVESRTGDIIITAPPTPFELVTRPPTPSPFELDAQPTPFELDCAEFVLELNFTNYANVTSWDMFQHTVFGVLLFEHGPYDFGPQTDRQTKCLLEGSYEFNLYDNTADGNGICCENGEVEYGIWVGDREIRPLSVANFDGSHSTAFWVTELDVKPISREPGPSPISSDADGNF